MTSLPSWKSKGFIGSWYYDIYDERGKLIHKQVPGGWQFHIIFDKHTKHTSYMDSDFKPEEDEKASRFAGDFIATCKIAIHQPKDTEEGLFKGPGIGLYEFKSEDVYYNN